jgi:hypothetical protein
MKMTTLVSFPSESGPPLLVEVAETDYGVERVAREDGVIVQASEKLEEALGRAIPTLRSVVNSIRTLAPDEAQIEFGLKLSAETGVVISKAALEAHFTVTLSWSKGHPAVATADGKDPGGDN